MEPYYQPEHFLFEVPTSFSLPTIEPCPLKLGLWHSRTITAGVVFPADPNLPLSNHRCHFMGWVIWYSSVYLVCLLQVNDFNRWLDSLRLLQGGRTAVRMFIEIFIWIKSVQPSFIDAICHQPLEHDTARSPALRTSCFIKTVARKSVNFEEAGNYEKQNGKSCGRNDDCFASTPWENFVVVFFFVVVYYPNPDVVSLGMYCTQGRIRLTDGVSRKKKSNESAWDFRDI